MSRNKVPTVSGNKLNPDKILSYLANKNKEIMFGMIIYKIETAIEFPTTFDLFLTEDIDDYEVIATNFINNLALPECENEFYTVEIKENKVTVGIRPKTKEEKLIDLEDSVEVTTDAEVVEDKGNCTLF